MVFSLIILMKNQFLYQIDKEETENNIILNKYFCDDKYQTIHEKTTVPYQILANKVDFETLNIKSNQILVTNDKLADIDGKKVIKLECMSKEIYKFILTELKDLNSKVYEQDLPVEHRHLINNNASLNIGSKPFIELKYLSVDIETIGQKDAQEIIMISTYSQVNKKMSKVYCDMSKIEESKLQEVTNTKFKDFELIQCKDEADLLIQFQQDTINFEPQLIIGWNVIDFDFKVIRERLNTFGFEFKLSKFTGNCKLNIKSGFFSDSTMVCPGMLIFDIIQVLKKNYIVFSDYKLDTVARVVLKDNKIDIEDDSAPDSIENKILAIENMFKKDPVKLIEYNFKDSLLVSEIVEKLGLLELMYKRSILTGTPLSKVKSPIATLDIMYLKKLHKKGLVANTNYNYAKSNQIEGAFVYEPTKGFYEDIFVLDFKSLYPSAMMTFNIDPFTQSKTGQIHSPTGAKFDKTPGILPEIILKLYKERDIAKKENDKNKSQALKITMNSFYGAMASPKSRYHNQELGESITGFARHIIQKAIEYTKQLGHEIVYGDTDSIFVKFNSKTPLETNEQKLSAGKQLESELNKYFENWVKTEFGQKNYLQIEFEKLYTKFFIATKKRYVGYDLMTKKTQFIGMEAIRGDWTVAAKEFQVKLVEMIFQTKSKEDIEKFIQDEIKLIESGELDNKLIYTKKITKPLDQYTKITPPHVKAAREVENFSGRVIKYYLTKIGPKHVSIYNPKKHELDYNHYIEKQIKGVSDDLLECLDIDFDEAINKKKQKSLDSFFN